MQFIAYKLNIKRVSALWKFVCTHRCSYKTTSFEKEQSIAYSWNARSKTIGSFEWYVPITARPNHFKCRNIGITFSLATSAHSFWMGVIK